ncbi:MAG: AMP-binding protein [Deltaproteobacteria bacterium]|nr:AMP-binding protein [Deltaproteobacteria bacterium]
MTAARDSMLDRLDALAPAPALRLGTTTYTWGELDRAAAALSALLDSSAPAGRIALCATDPALVAAALLLALRGNRTLILLHPRLTPDERLLLLQDAEADCLLTDHEAAAPLPTYCVASGALALGAAATPPISTCAGAPPLLLLYTSGTTGRPKGAMLSSAALWAAATASSERLQTGADDRWLACMPFAHIGGLSILLRALHDGLFVVAQPRFHAATVAASLHRDAITRLSLVPTMLRDLLDAGATPPPTLRTLLLGGAAAPPDLVRRAIEAGWPVATTYGLTEAAAQVTTATPAQTAANPESSGLPLPGYRLRITDPAADGVGQVEVAAPSLMTGYHRRPDDTAAALCDGWLRTGDLGRLLPDGQLCLVARRTDLIVSGGENIYPAEIEAALRTLPEVAEACVVGLPSDRWGQAVAAMLVLRPGASLTLEALRAALALSLAPFKHPRALLFISALPQTAAGKVDRRSVASAFAEAPKQT